MIAWKRTFFVLLAVTAVWGASAFSLSTFSVSELKRMSQLEFPQGTKFQMVESGYFSFHLDAQVFIPAAELSDFVQNNDLVEDALRPGHFQVKKCLSEGAHFVRVELNGQTGQGHILVLTPDAGGTNPCRPETHSAI